MVGFGLRRKLGTAGTERDSPLVLPPWPGGILILLAGFVLFSTVVFLGRYEYWWCVICRQINLARGEGWGEIFRLITLGDHTDNCAGTYSNEGMQTRGFSGICQNLKN